MIIITLPAWLVYTLLGMFGVNCVLDVVNTALQGLLAHQNKLLADQNERLADLTAKVRQYRESGK